MRVCKMTSLSFFCLVILVLAGSTVVKAADWSNTIAAAVLNDRLYTIEKSGALFGTDLATRKWVQIGKAEFAGTRLLLAGPQNLFTIETDGSLYKINPSDGTWSRVGKPGVWKNTIAGIFIGGRLFTIESSGALYGTNPVSGAWVQIGKAEFANTRSVFRANETLFTLETDGSLYRVSTSDGAWRGVGAAGSWKNTIAGTSLSGKLYTIEASGALFETNPDTGTWKQIGKAEFAKTRYLFTANGSLYTIEDAGLYRVDPATGAWAAVGN